LCQVSEILNETEILSLLCAYVETETQNFENPPKLQKVAANSSAESSPHGYSLRLLPQKSGVARRWILLST